MTDLTRSALRTGLCAILLTTTGLAALHDNDIDAGWIQRLPSIPYVWGSTNATRAGWPTNDQVIIWRAFVKNWSDIVKTNVAYTWSLDGVVIATGVVTMATNAHTTVDLAWPWTFNRHSLSFVIDSDNIIPEFSELNNRVYLATDAISVGFWVERTTYNYFHQYQKDLGIGANGWEDWAQRQVTRWNQMFQRAVYPEAPTGVLDRIRLDQINIVADGALPLNGGYASNDPDYTNQTVDLQWGFPVPAASNFSFYSDHTTINDDKPFYFEGSLIHELGHARYLIDTYGFNYHENPAYNPPNPPWWSNCTVQVNGKWISGTPYLPINPPWADSVYFPTSFGWPGYGLMSGPYDMVDRYSAPAMNLIAGRRAILGNYNSPGNIGVYLQNLPTQNVLTVRGALGEPISNATVKIYQAQSVSGSWYGKKFTNAPSLTLATDADGRVALGRCPFSTSGRISHGYGLSRGDLMLRVEQGAQTGFGFLNAMEFNLAFWRGNVQTATYALGVAMLDDTFRIAGITPTNGYRTPLGSSFDVAVVMSGTTTPTTVRVNGSAASYYYGAWRLSVTPAKGTNVYTVTASGPGGLADTQAVTCVRQDTTPPQIGCEAQLNPYPGARLFNGQAVSARWIAYRINDEADGVNCTITRMSVLAFGTTNELAVIGANFSNSGTRSWTIPPGLVSTTTLCALRIDARDTSMNETNRIFTAFPFTIEPDTLPPYVADDALTFPTNGARLLFDMARNVTWSAAKITDLVNGTSCVITWISAHDAMTTQEVAQIASNVNNTAGMAAWTPPANLINNVNGLVIRFVVRDAASNTTEHIFWPYPFLVVVPEPTLLAGTALIILCLRARRSSPAPLL